MTTETEDWVVRSSDVIHEGGSLYHKPENEYAEFQTLHEMRLLIDDEPTYKTIIEKMICQPSKNS